jgi:hypothetical protein
MRLSRRLSQKTNNQIEKLAQNYDLQFGAISNRLNFAVKEEELYIYNLKTNKTAILGEQNNIEVIDRKPSYEDGEIYIYDLKTIQRLLPHEKIDQMIQATL